MSTSPNIASRPTGVDVADVPPYTPVRRGDRGSVAPLSPDWYRVQLTVSGATRDKLLRAQQLLRRGQPDGDLAVSRPVRASVTRNCMISSIPGWSAPGASPLGNGTGASFVTPSVWPARPLKSTTMSARSPRATGATASPKALAL